MNNREESEKPKLPELNITTGQSPTELVPFQHEAPSRTTADPINPPTPTFTITKRHLIGVDPESKPLLTKFMSGSWTMDGFLGTIAIITLWLGELISIKTIGLLLGFLLVFHYALRPILEKIQKKLGG